MDLRTDPAVVDFDEFVMLDQRHLPVDHLGRAVVHVDGVPATDDLQHQDPEDKHRNTSLLALRSQTQDKSGSEEG